MRERARERTPSLPSQPNPAKASLTQPQWPAKAVEGGEAIAWCGMWVWSCGCRASRVSAQRGRVRAGCGRGEGGGGGGVRARQHCTAVARFACREKQDSVCVSRVCMAWRLGVVMWMQGEVGERAARPCEGGVWAGRGRGRGGERTSFSQPMLGAERTVRDV